MTGRAAGSVLDRLRHAAGDDAVLDAADAARWAVAGVEPAAVLAPATTAAAAAVMALCSEHGWPVEPAGAGTWLAAGAPPARPPVVVSTSRLTAIHEYEPADLVVGVQAGMPLSDLETELRRQRQTLPLDPPAAGAASLGAITALAAAGPLRALHGTPRDAVRGVEIVSGDGRVLRFGGRVVKNVAGYDIVRLLVGSRGSFGLITSLYLRLRGAPVRDATWSATADDAVAAARLALAVRRRMDADAVEVVSPALAVSVGLADRAADGWLVLVRSRGGAEAVEDTGRRLQTLSEAFTLVDPAAAAAGWQHMLDEEAAAPWHVWLSAPQDRLPDALALAETTVSGAARSIAAHGGDGVVRVWGPAGEDPALVLERLRDGMRTLDGTATCPICPEPWRGAVAGVPEPVPAQLRLQRELKARFDPAGVLSPGRHLRGL